MRLAGVGGNGRPLSSAPALAGLVASVLAASAVAIAGPLTFDPRTGPGAGFVFELDAFSTALLLLIWGVGAVVLSFSSRYAVDDPRPRRLHGLILAALVAASATATAATVLAFALGWLGTSAALAGLLAHRTDLPGSARSLRRSLAATAVADLALVGAVVIILGATGNISLRDLTTASAGPAGVDALGLLLVLAAAGRCAQLPLGGWLMQTLVVPTPVSAVLHAGIVNAGAVLLIAFAPIITASAPAMGVLFAIAAASMLAATALMVVRPDVKGALALSTRGQMGFMLLACAIGAFAAAAFHLIAHGMYKAALFLGSGGAIDAARAQRESPTTQLLPEQGREALRPAAVAVLAPAGLLAVASLALLREVDAATVALLGFAWAGAAQASWWWIRFRAPAGAAAFTALAALAAGSLAYVALLALTKGALEAALPTAGSGAVPGWLIIPVLAVAVSFTGLRWAAAAGLRVRTDSLPDRVRDRLYAELLAHGEWPRRRAIPPRLPRGRTRDELAGLATRIEAAR